jgi:hypothetical protein
MKTTRDSQGLLTGQSFLTLVGALNRRCATGALRLTQDSADGPIEKALFFERGEVYAAASNVAADVALIILVRAGKLTQAEAAEVERQVLAGRNLGESLIASHGFTPEDFAALRTAHVTAIFNSVCEWSTGSWEFVARARVPGGPLGCDTLTLLLGQARRLCVPDDFRRRAAAPHRHIVRTQNENAPVRAKLTAREEYLLELIHSPLGFEALCRTAALSEREIWQGLYALSCAGLIAFTPILQPRAEWVAVEASAAGPAAAARPEYTAETSPREVRPPEQEEVGEEVVRPQAPGRLRLQPRRRRPPRLPRLGRRSKPSGRKRRGGKRRAGRSKGSRPSSPRRVTITPSSGSGSGRLRAKCGRLSAASSGSTTPTAFSSTRTRRRSAS